MKKQLKERRKSWCTALNFETLPLRNRPQDTLHLPQAQCAPKFCSIDISIRSSITRSLRSWNLSEKIFCLLYFPFWMSKRCALQAKFVTSGMKYRIPTSCGNHMCGSSATDGRFQLILVELKTGNRALLSSLQDVCIQDRLRKQKKNWVSILWRLC